MALIPRAQRFPLQLPLCFRPLGEAGWLGGSTQNISHSGVLFHAERSVAVNTPIEIALVLPVDILGDRSGQVICAGRVVRALGPGADDARPGLAATITDYRLVRGGSETNNDIGPGPGGGGWTKKFVARTMWDSPLVRHSTIVRN